MVSRTVLTRSGPILVNAARPVNTVQLKTAVNNAGPMKKDINNAYSTTRRPFNKITTTNNSNFSKKVNTVKGKRVNTVRPKAVVNTARPKVVLNLKDKGVIDSGCSRHITGNRSYLTDYAEINGGFVAFEGNSKGGKITKKGKIRTGKLDFEDVYFVKELKFNLFSVSKMCDKKNSVLFTDTACVVLSPDFKLTDESHVLLKVPRKDNMYNIDLKNVVPQGGLTCLFLKATPDESNLWHRRLRHINFKTMNKLVKGNLVRGLPSKLFEINQTCVACQNGKQHRASCRKPALSFMRPFGCPVTILNTIDHLGKFDGKADEGFFVGYSTNSKAFRVFNSRTRIVEENLHVQFSENTPILQEVQKHVMMQNLKDSPYVGFNPSGEEEEKDTEDPGNEDQVLDAGINNTNNINTASDGNSTNNVNTVSSTVNTTGSKVNVVDPKTSIKLPNDPNMLELEEIVYSANDEDVGAEADINNLDTHIPVSPIPTTRIHKDHPVFKNKKDERGTVIKNKARLVAQGYTQEEGIDYDEVFAPVAKIEEIRLFLAYASFKDFVVYQMDVKSAFLYGKIEEEVYVCQPLGFEDPEFPDRVNKVEKALYGLHQAPRAWYKTLSTYLLDNGFQRGKIDKTLFIKRDKSDILLVQVYVDDIIFWSTRKKMCTEFKKMMHKKFQMSSMGELIFFLARTPMETQKALLKDADGEDIDEHLYRSMIGSLMYLTSSRPDIMFATKIYIDNESTICIVKNLVFHSKIKHIKIRHHFIRDSNEKKLIQIIKIHTYQNVADLLTKAFNVNRFQYLIASI
ncbi:putative ribonuclease H-like domain-containing protein [Tanacetum coccineum]|uniref:Ribonuclease H-like domain-containing protein n=1 Tax=Tanacetum coccineum TaxID=301880 RepID=A0ABQ5ESJ3_9ASTR